MYRQTSAGWCSLFAAGLLFLGVLHAADDPLELAVRAADLDVAACGTIHNGETRPADKTMMLRALGLTPMTGQTENWWHKWSAGRAGLEPGRAGKQQTNVDTFQYQLAFTRPVAVGSILCTNQSLAYLKADAPYPGDPAKPEHWVVVPIPPMQTAVRIAALPPKVQTRAILLTDHLRQGSSTAMPVRLYRRRLHNVASAAAVAASSEYQAPQAFGSGSFAAANVVRGRSSWQSNGKADTGRIYGPIISDIQPVWFALAWDQPTAVSAVIMLDNFKELKFYRYEEAKGEPLVAPADAWAKVPSACWRARRSRCVPTTAVTRLSPSR